MNIADKDLIIFDLDGTLSPAKSQMQADTAAALAKLLAIKKVAVISGGAFPQFQTQFLASLPSGVEGFSNLYLMPTSGTRLLTWNGSWTERYAENMAPQEKAAVMGAFHAALLSAGYHEPAKVYGPVIEDRGSQITFSALGQSAPLAEKVKWDPDRQKREAIAEILKDKLPQFDVRIGGTTSLDVTRRGVNKAYGIRKLEEFLKVVPDKIVFIGDALFYGGNDYPAKTTGVDCIAVTGPDETTKLINGWVGA